MCWLDSVYLADPFSLARHGLRGFGLGGGGFCSLVSASFIGIQVLVDHRSFGADIIIDLG